MYLPPCFRAKLFLMALVLWTSAPARGTGLYQNLPWWFAPRDTARCTLRAGQARVAAEHGDADVLSLESHVRTDRRTLIRIGLLYPVVRRGGGFGHGLADLLVGGEMSIVADSTRRSGLFLRADVRVPTGTRNQWPYAWESLDGGAGIELRRGGSAIDMRLSLAGNLAGSRVVEGERRHENHALVAATVGIEPLPGSSVRLAVFGQFFRFGGSRRVYLLDFGAHPTDQIELRLCAGLDAGAEKDRVFESLLQFYLVFRFPLPPPPVQGADPSP